MLGQMCQKYFGNYVVLKLLLENIFSVCYIVGLCWCHLHFFMIDLYAPILSSLLMNDLSTSILNVIKIWIFTQSFNRLLIIRLCQFKYIQRFICTNQHAIDLIMTVLLTPSNLCIASCINYLKWWIAIEKKKCCCLYFSLVCFKTQRDPVKIQAMKLFL